MISFILSCAVLGTGQLEESIIVTVAGRLRAGLVAIGGETTGVTITAKGITWKLAFGRNVEFAEAARKRDGKHATITGTLERKRGVEVKERWIVTVATLK